MDRDALEDLLTIARTVGPMIHPAAPAAILIAETTLRLIDRFGGDDPEATQIRAELEARVNAHADRTAASLG